MKKPGEQVFESSHSDGNLLTTKKITATANYISSSIVESEILGFILHEWVWNNENFYRRIAAFTLMIFPVYVINSFMSRMSQNIPI